MNPNLQSAILILEEQIQSLQVDLTNPNKSEAMRFQLSAEIESIQRELNRFREILRTEQQAERNKDHKDVVTT